MSEIKKKSKEGSQIRLTWSVQLNQPCNRLLSQKRRKHEHALSPPFET